MKIAKICVLAYYNSFRTSFFMLVFNKDIIDNIINFLVTNLVLFLATFIPAIFEDKLFYISTLGGFFALVCYLGVVRCFYFNLLKNRKTTNDDKGKILNMKEFKKTSKEILNKLDFIYELLFIDNEAISNLSIKNILLEIFNEKKEN